MTHADREQPTAYDPQWDNHRDHPSNWDTQQQPVVGQPSGHQQDPGYQGHYDATGELPQVSQWQQAQQAQPAQPSQPPQPQWQQLTQPVQPAPAPQWQPDQQWPQQPPQQPPQQAPQPGQQWPQQPPQQPPAGQQWPQQPPQQPPAGQPPAGQPPAGQPPAGQPPAGQPPAGQPQPQLWQQPSPLGQPQAAQWQPPPTQWQAPPRKSRRGLWIGLAAGATALVMLAGCGVAFVFWRSAQKPVEGLSSSPSVSRSPSTPRKPASAVTMVRPEKIGNRNRITTGEYATKAAKAEEDLKSSLKPGGSLVVAFYGTTDRKVDQIYVVASTIPGPLKKSTFETQFEKPTSEGQPVTNLVNIPVGALGGFMKCGQTIRDGMDVAMCAFSNEYDYGVVQWYNRKLTDEIKKEIVTIRTLLER